MSDFPPTASSNYEDLLVEYLEVYVPKEQEQLESKDLHDGCLKSEGSASDSDSGRGSCDSHTLLLDKCMEAKEKERQTDQERMGTGQQRYQKVWQEDALAYSHEDMVSPDMSTGRVKTWPSVFSPLLQYSSSPLEQQSSLEIAKQQYLSDSLLPPGPTPSYLTQPGHSTKEALGPSYWEFCSNNRHPHLLHPQMQACRQLQAHSDINISSIGRERAPAGLAALQSTENAEVQRVAEEDTALLQPAQSGSGRSEGCPQVPQGEDYYSKVKGVDRDNMLLLQGEEMEEDMCSCAHQETNRVKENCCASSHSYKEHATKKPAHSATPIHDKMVVAANGYVDTATICTLPAF